MRILVLTVWPWLRPTPAFAQRIGVLPFEDASGLRAEFAEQGGKFIQPKDRDSATVDVEEAVALGEQNGVNSVVIGTILEAETTGSSSGIGGIRVVGQSVGSCLRAVTASIALQDDLVSVKQGALVESFRSSAGQTDRSVGADVSMEWGRLNSDRDAGGNAPTARALREAVERLVRAIGAKLRP